MSTSPHHSLVIGGTRGMGRALVQRLLRNGNKVSVLARNIPPESGREKQVNYSAANITETEKFVASLRNIIETQGRLQSLIFLQRYRGEGDSWEGEMETSLNATRHAIDCLKDDFGPARDNSIVIVNSNASTIVVDEQPLSYHVAKAALLQIVRYYAVNLGPLSIRGSAPSRP
jgi:NAD(P)-dependent dehydrogenase (short-subunit alcohol dehydrogenase family)